MAPSARVPLSAPEPHRVQLMIPAVPSFLFLLYSLFYTSLIWRFVCTCKKGFNLQTFWMLSPRWLRQDRPCMALQTWGLGKTSGLGQGLGLRAHALRFLWQAFFLVQTWMWLIRDITSQSWQLSCMYLLSGMLFCVFQGLFCGMASFLQLDQGTVHTTLPLTSRHSLWRRRDCPARHASRKKTQFIYSEWKTQAAFKRMKTGSQKKARRRYIVFITFLAKVPQF